MTEQHNIPTKISYTDADVRRASADPMLSEGWYPLVIVGAKRTVSKKGNLTILTRMRALTDPEDPSSAKGPTVFNRVTLPVTNPDIEGHVAPNTNYFAGSFLLAVYSDPSDAEYIPGYPAQVDGEWMHGASEIDVSEIGECKSATNTALFQRYIDLWNGDMERLDGYRVYGEIVHNQGGDGRTYQNVGAVSGTLPDAVDLVSADNFMV